METWKPIEGYEDKYEVSTMGNVRSLNYRNTGKTHILKPVAAGKGYLMVGLCRNCTMKWEKVHRLVAKAFIPNPESKPQVNHINGIKTDNHIENLEWVTESENQKHAYKKGLKKGKPEWGKILGTKHGKEAAMKHAMEVRKAVIATNIETGETIIYESAAEVERILGINHSSIPKICTGRQKTAKGYTFKYASNENDQTTN